MAPHPSSRHVFFTFQDRLSRPSSKLPISVILTLAWTWSVDMTISQSKLAHVGEIGTRRNGPLHRLTICPSPFCKWAVQEKWSRLMKTTFGQLLLAFPNLCYMFAALSDKACAKKCCSLSTGKLRRRRRTMGVWNGVESRWMHSSASASCSETGPCDSAAHYPTALCSGD